MLCSEADELHPQGYANCAGFVRRAGPPGVREKKSWMEKGVAAVLGGSDGQPATSLRPCVQRMTLDTGLQEVRFNGFVCFNFKTSFFADIKVTVKHFGKLQLKAKVKSK